MHAEQAELAELFGELADRKVADLEPLGDIRGDMLGAKLSHGVARRELVAGQGGVQAQWVVSVKGGRRISAHRSQPATNQSLTNL